MRRFLLPLLLLSLLLAACATRQDVPPVEALPPAPQPEPCLLYTSDAADE